jgi:uncharacterized pyridoxal phosphate-containing UPF0001 family protein
VLVAIRESDVSAVDNLAAIKQKISRAERKAEREAGGVELVAVSKTFEAEAIRPVLEAGQRVFGEPRSGSARQMAGAASRVSRSRAASHWPAAIQQGGRRCGAVRRDRDGGS